MYKLSQIDSGQSTFKGGSSFTINNMLRQTVPGTYITTYKSSSSRMRVIYHNWSAMKQRPHPQSVAEISHQIRHTNELERQFTLQCCFMILNGWPRLRITLQLMVSKREPASMSTKPCNIL